MMNGVTSITPHVSNQVSANHSQPYNHVGGVTDFMTSQNVHLSQMGGTTGYSSNQGVWFKMQLEHDQQLQQQQQQQQKDKKSKTNNKRKKWKEKPDIEEKNKTMYQIQEEEEMQRERSNYISENHKPEESNTLPKINTNTTKPIPKKVTFGDMNENCLPSILITLDQETEQNLTLLESPPSEDPSLAPVFDTLKPPVLKPKHSLFKPVPLAAFYNPPEETKTFIPPETNENVEHSEALSVVSRYLESPKYTHIRVPRRLEQVTHVSQESIDSPFMLPKLDRKSPKLLPSRKPVKISLSQSTRLAKSSLRKKWNFRSHEEPLNYYTTPQSAGSVNTRNTEETDRLETRASARHSNLTASSDNLSLDNIQKKTLIAFENEINDENNNIMESMNDNVKQDINGNCDSPHGLLPNIQLKRKPPLCNKVNAVLTTQARKKWTLQDHWKEPHPAKDGPSRGSQPAKRRGSKTVKKSKRMAARLDGHSSAEVDSSKSVSESTESRPPIPQRKSEEKISRKGAVQKSLEQKKQGADKPTEDPPAVTRDRESETELEDTLKAGNTTVSSSVSVASSQDDTPMLQKLKDMNKKEMSSSRKKDVPRWLKQEDISTPFENPPESRDGPRPEPNKPDALPSNSRTPGNKTVTPPGTKARATPSKARTPPRKEVKPSTPPTQEEINMLIDEEMSLFPDQKKGVDLPEPAESEENPTTPMQRIEKNRSKWRESPGMNLEESWGSLSQFNKCQRGRLSLDMDDDVMDEYINKAAKMAGLPTEPAIPEEEGGDTEQQMQQPLTDSDDENFVIPELPQGRELVLNIRSTWGDKHYVGLTGIEVFAATGEQVNIIKVHANPSDINILPEYNKDPRVVKNIIDGQNRTRDDIHMWLAPFMQGMDHTVHCTFDKPCKVAIIRIWNYNKSRIHSYRGARDVVMALDQTVIFRGEIARACGGIEGGTEAFGDTILFTTDEVILEKVSQNDEAYEAEMLSDDEPFDVERPSTADEGEEKGRPLTRAVGNIKALERELTVQYEGDMMVFRGRYLELNFTATWGDMHYLGLTGLEVVGKDGDALPVDVGMISANPRDVRVLPGHEEDDRTLDKVVDGTNITMSDEHMWLVPFTDGQNHTVTIDFGQKELMAGLRVWNYNKSKEDTYRGARIMHVNIDGKTVSPPEGFLVRKGLGTCHFDFAQEISFSPQSWVTNAPLSAMGQSMDDDNYEVVQMPCGFIYQLQLFSTWGDAYYVGLNGIELYDANNKKIQLTESNISAYPDSVNVLDNIDSDVRTPDKLIDGVNDTLDGGHMWLAPILPNMLNRVYVIFDQPTTISMLKIWNYSKTANRGAKDFALLVDDLLVYNGVLQSVPQTARGILPTCEGPQPYHTILFTNNKEVLRKERNTVINHQTGEQDVQMTNDKKIVTHYNDPHKAKSGKTVDQNLRPTTSVIHSKKRR